MDGQTNSASKSWRQRWLQASALVAMLLGLGFWLVFVSPYTWLPPEDHATLDDTARHRVFAYGTLRNPLLRSIIVRRVVTTEAATLPGYRREGLDLRVDAGARTEGRVFEVNGAELRRLDRYERLGTRYLRTAELLNDDQSAWVYRRLPSGTVGDKEQQ